jgi:hypothetical protein
MKLFLIILIVIVVGCLLTFYIIKNNNKEPFDPNKLIRFGPSLGHKPIKHDHPINYLLDLKSSPDPNKLIRFKESFKNKIDKSLFSLDRPIESLPCRNKIPVKKQINKLFKYGYPKKFSRNKSVYNLK